MPWRMLSLAISYASARRSMPFRTKAFIDSVSGGSTVRCGPYQPSFVDGRTRVVIDFGQNSGRMLESLLVLLVVI